MANEPYFQFPLCALSFGDSVQERLNSIISYATIEAGVKLWGKLSLKEQEGRAIGFRMWQDCPKEARWDNSFHCAVLYGAEVIGVTIGGFLAMVNGHARLRGFIAAFERQHGCDARVRVKKGWVFNARDNCDLQYRELAVLCAIYSVIGDKELARVTRAMIQRRALGYRTAAIMAAEVSRRADKAQPLTERRLRDTIDLLHRNKFFARATVSRRITYYSIRLDGDAFRKNILERRTYPGSFHAIQSAQDQALTDAIRRRRREPQINH